MIVLDRRAASAPVEAGLRGSLRLAALLLAASAAGASAQQPEGVVELTLERMVELGLSDSYQVRRLNMEIERTRHLLRAEQAALRSRVELEVAAPEFQAISATYWNSEEQRNEIVREDTRRWEAQLSVRQPVVLFGYPTDGTLSLNNRVYRYRQLIGSEGERDVSYYNRYFVEYEQPLFQPNELRNELEEARLGLERAELGFQDDVVDMLDDLSGDYFELFEEAYRERIYERLVQNLEAASVTAAELAVAVPARAIEGDQIRVELANAREQLQRTRSDFRLQAASLKQRLRLEPGDSITLDPVLDVRPVDIDVSRAVELATSLTPRFRELAIARRQDEIDLDETRGENSFRMDVSLSYGREMEDPAFRNLWEEPENSYTLDVSAYLPIWDWGARKSRIAAAEIELEQRDLQIEESRSQTVSDVQNEVRSVAEYESRAVAMEENLDLAREISATSLERYRDGVIQVVDLLQSFRREVDTEANLLDAYLGWQQALLDLQQLTFYDFERRMPVLERFGIVVPDGAGS